MISSWGSAQRGSPAALAAFRAAPPVPPLQALAAALHAGGASSGSSGGGFNQQLLSGLGAPDTSENERFLAAWRQAEGGSNDNPFNTTEDAPGAQTFNSVGVKRYPSISTGVDATLRTLQNGRYGNILAALARGDSAMADAQAVAASPWGTGALIEKVLGR